MREAARRLRSGGRIISLSSSVVGLYQPTYGVYAATKAGVEALTHVLANELRGRNITANVVAPGFIETEMTDVLPEARKAEIIKAVPAGRLASADEVAAAVTFLAGDSAAYISGAVIPVDGGLGMGH